MSHVMYTYLIANFGNILGIASTLWSIDVRQSLLCAGHPSGSRVPDNGSCDCEYNCFQAFLKIVLTKEQ